MDKSGIRHWVLVETGANQAYVFGTNRLRHVVGASHLIHQAGTDWVPAAAKRHGASVVLAISGKSLLLVDDPAAGRAVINEVSLRALREAPGLEVTGAVGPGFDPELRWQPDSAGPDTGGPSSPVTHVDALTRTYGLLESVRATRPSAQLRDPMLPWFGICPDSGYPAAGAEQHPDGDNAAAAVLAKSAVRGAARNRMRDLLCDMPGVVPENLDDLRNDGWLAVIHADGNGVGRVFTHFAGHALRAGQTTSLTLDRHAELLRCFTEELEDATKKALRVAVRDATAGQDAEASLLTGAATATPPPPAPSQGARGTPTSARSRSCRTWPPWPSSSAATRRRPMAPYRSRFPIRPRP